jgi:GT2 family glycosyltransferase
MTRDRADDLRRSLPRHEAPVVVVDNGSTDGTADVVAARHAAGQDVTMVLLAGNRGAPARTVGVRAVSTPYVAFADDDSWWAPGALARAVTTFDAHPRLALLAGRILVAEEEREDPLSTLMAEAPWGRSPDMPGPDVLGFAACGAIVRREAYLSVGGFDDVVFFAGEEERVAYDLAADGWGMAYVPEVVAHHHPRASANRIGRAALIRRNALLTAWMRRPLPVAASLTVGSWRAGGHEREAAAAAVRRLPAALAHRRVNPARVEDMLAAVAGDVRHGG